MNTSKKVIAALVTTVIGLAGVSGVVVAGQSDSEHQERAAMMNAKISLSQAIAAAEKETGGRAVEASWDGKEDRQAYEVEVLAVDGTEAEVKVSAIDGSILSKAESNDRDDDSDDEHESKRPRQN